MVPGRKVDPVGFRGKRFFFERTLIYGDKIRFMIKKTAKTQPPQYLPVHGVYGWLLMRVMNTRTVGGSIFQLSYRPINGAY